MTCLAALTLFEEGSLVDFEIDELAKLVRALFADTTCSEGSTYMLHELIILLVSMLLLLHGAWQI